MDNQKIIFIVGPTAVGKTAVAVGLAKRLNGEIISCDAMQVYEGIEIVTDKPPREFLSAAPHHLMDMIPLQQEFDVAAFNQQATKALEQILARGRTPIVVGGSGLYMQVLLDGIFDEGKKDGQLRAQLKRRADKEGIASVYAELKKVDPCMAEKIHPHDARRIIRALEVYCQTQKPLSALKQKRCGLWGKYDIRIFALNRDRQEIYCRIEQRVDKMFARGLVDEIHALGGVHLSKTAQAIIGIDEVQGYLKGAYDLEHAKDLMKRHTRRLAKKQLTWFRKEKRLTWLMIQKQDSVDVIIQKIIAEL